MRKSKSAYRNDMKRGMTLSTKQVPPPQGVMVEAKRAKALAEQEPLRYAFGDPLPGRSALDKLKREGRAP